MLSSLNLCEETHLVLHVPAKVTVSPAAYLPCNIPDIPSAVKWDEESDEMTVPRFVIVYFNMEAQSVRLVRTNHPLKCPYMA